MMILVYDIIFLILSTIFAAVSYRRLFDRRLNTFVDFVVLVIYVFMCLPIACNYIVGIPAYSTASWYKVFIPGMQDEMVTLIYNYYVLLVMTVLYFYSSKKSREPETELVRLDVSKHRTVLLCITLLPFVAVIASGHLLNYQIYADSSARGLDDTYIFIMNSCLLLSLLAFTALYFGNNKRNYKHIFILILYSFGIAWISGKRFILAVILLMYLFAFLCTEKDEKKRRLLYRSLPVAILLLFAFCGFYMAAIKPLSNTLTYDVYEMLRVDFGRDDVTKYVIYQMVIQNNAIIDYPGQTIFSFVLFFIPRLFWPTKPFQHFQYLTSSILGVPILSIPAGTTPSGFEMFFANFGFLGIPLFALILLLFIKLFDASDASVMLRLLGLILTVVILTQSVDVYLVYVLLSAIFLLKQFYDRSKAKKVKRLKTRRIVEHVR